MPMQLFPQIAAPFAVAGRLTLTSGVPVTNSDVVAATTVYWTPYKGNQIQLWDGNAWTPYTSVETGLALGTVTAALPYDVFAYQSSGVLALEKLAWTNATTRATAVTLQDGRYCKSGDKTRLYLGTFYTTSTTTTEDSAGGTTSQVGAKRFLWNVYNRAERAIAVFDSTAFYTYGTNVWRQQNNNAGNKVEFVRGLDEDAVNFTNTECLIPISQTARGQQISIGLDSTTTPITNIAGYLNNSTSSLELIVGVNYCGLPGAGYHALNCLEKGGDGTSRFGIDVTGQPISMGMLLA